MHRSRLQLRQYRNQQHGSFLGSRLWHGGNPVCRCSCVSVCAVAAPKHVHSAFWCCDCAKACRAKVTSRSLCVPL
jgi:hypothetical protein